LLFLNSLLRNGHFFLKFVSGVLLALAILALYNLWKKLNFRILRFSYKRIFIAIFSILFIFALLSPLKSLNIFYNELKIIPIPVPNSDFLTDSGENYGSGDSEANNGIPDGWEFGDWSPKRPAASLSLSSQHYKKDGTSLEIKTLNSPAFFRLRTILIPISCYKRIIISSYMKKDNGLSPFYWAAFFDQDYRILTDMQGIRFFNKFEDWKLAKFECIVPEQAYYIQVSVSLWGNVELNRRFWIDSISLYGKK